MISMADVEGFTALIDPATVLQVSNGTAVTSSMPASISGLRRDLMPMRHVALALVAVVLALTSCSGHSASRYGVPPDAQGNGLREPELSSASGAPSGTDDERVLHQYRKFWTSTLPAAYAAPAGKRQAVLGRVVTAELVAPLMERISKLEATGRTAYGSDSPISEQIEYSKRVGGYVLVRGCLDSSRTGVAELTSGRILTVGVPHNPVRVNLRRTADGEWLVSSLHFPGGYCS